MEYKKAKPVTNIENLEVCVNLWWFVDSDSGLVLRVSGRGYALSGDDNSKLKILKQLALTDFHIAEIQKIPSNFKLNSEHGTMESVVPASQIKQYPEIFEPVYLKIEKDLPTQVRSVNGEYKVYKLKVPQDPLCIVTCVVEGNDGSLTPMLS